MTDLDLMTERQFWIMAAIAAAFWFALIRAWWLERRAPRRRRVTYQAPGPGPIRVNIANARKR